MSPDTILTLGSFSFASFEVPEVLRFGTTQRLAIKQRIGGKRVIDAMGVEEQPLEWRGVFTGPDAAARAQFLQSLVASGQQQDLSWAQFKYQVVVHQVDADYERFYRVPYRIVCEVVANQTVPVTQPPPTAIDPALADDLNSLQGLGGILGDGLLNTILGTLDTAIGAVSTFANAAQSVISSVLTPLNAIQSRVGTLIQSTNTTLQNVTTFGGVLPNTPFSQAAGFLSGQTSAMLQLNNLFQMRNIAGRMGANLVSINTPPTKVATAGGNLFALAASQYGDATAWTALAKANDLTDPFVSGTAILSVPKSPDNSGGILSA